MPAPTTPPSLLTYTVIGAFVTFFGTLVALFVKEFLLVKYFDDRRDMKRMNAVFKRYKDPIR